MLFHTKTAPKLVSFGYSSCGGMRGCHFEYSAVLAEDNAKIEIEESESFNFPIRRQCYTVPSELMDTLSEITTKYKVYRWHGLKLFKEQLLDAPSLNVCYKFEDGTTVHYGHGEILPEYGVHREIIDRIKEFCRNENSDLSLKEKAEAQSEEIYVCITEVTNGYVRMDITNKTDKRIDTDYSYKIYKGDTLLCENYLKQEEYRPIEFFPNFPLPLLINLNECGKLHSGEYSIEFLGVRCGFELIEG